MTEPSGAVEGRRPAGQLLRYGLVGAASNISGYLVYLLITYFGVEPKLTMTLVYAAAATIGYVGNRQWAFAHKGAVLGSSARYLIAHLLGYTLNLSILYIFVDRLGYAHQWVQAVAIAVVAGFLFVLFRYFVFPANKVVANKT